MRKPLMLAAVGLLVACTAPGPAPATPVRLPTPLPTAVSVPAPNSCQFNHKPDGRVLPDIRCTPGALNPEVNQSNIQSTICKPGYATSVRPPVEFTSALKLRQMAEYGVGWDNPAGYEEDHLIPLELGGAPADPANLWPEPGASPNEKDSIENRLHAQVCAGQTSLTAAQGILAADWTMAR